MSNWLQIQQHMKENPFATREELIKYYVDVLGMKEHEAQWSIL